MTPLNGETLTAADLVDALVGTGISTSNETYAYASQAAGTFSGGTGIIGFESGVLLTSGDVANVVGPNESDAMGTINEAPGDPDLDALAGATTHDASILSFRFVPVEPTVTFRYVFASDEYNEFVSLGFNDVFGFFVNGTNCAKVPDTDVPVSIDTINNASHPDLYRNNEISDGSAPLDTEMDGLTVVLTCTAGVTPGVPNTAKLAIADAGDFVVDSAVFLEAGSFSSGPTHTLTVTTSGDGDGVVSSSDDGISCDSTNPELNDCDEVYAEDTEVTLTASPSEGSVFGGWTGCDSEEGSTCSVTMSDEGTVDARFDPESEEGVANRALPSRTPHPASAPTEYRAGGWSRIRCRSATADPKMRPGSPCQTPRRTAPCSRPREPTGRAGIRSRTPSPARTTSPSTPRRTRRTSRSW